MTRICFVASESLPFIKSGGLADVVGSLPQELLKKGHEVRVFLPMYQKVALKYREQMERKTGFQIHVGTIHTYATIFEYVHQGVTFNFVEHAGYFEREGLYGYPDDGERFSYFSHAVLMSFGFLNYFPDVVHSHDWHTGMIPVLCSQYYGHDERYKRIRHVYTIHNLAYQGNFPGDMLQSCLGLPMALLHDGTLHFNDGISFMKAGILYANKITTVSPSYAQEILTPQYGEKMEDVLRFRRPDLVGIVNGIDVDAWDPQTDETLAEKYSVKKLTGKVKNKLAVQKELGLREAKDVFLVAMVSRLTWQKGVHLIIERMADIMGLDLQLMVLGSGEHHMESQLKYMEEKYRQRMVFYGGYNEELAHRIYAGADLLLMPSLFEPCGISQLIAMRYGTLPLVRETGGLKDTVTPANLETFDGTGFSFAQFNSDDLYHVLRIATFAYYQKPAAFKHLMINAMNRDVSWKKSADEYAKVYEECLK